MEDSEIQDPESGDLMALNGRNPPFAKTAKDGALLRAVGRGLTEAGVGGLQEWGLWVG